MVDALVAIFPNFDVVFLFDDALYINNMNVSYGGTSNTMRSAVMHSMGSYPATLEIEDE